MGCSSSITHTSDNLQQPVKNFSLTVIRHESKIIQFAEPLPTKTNESTQNPKNQLILKKQEKIKQLKNNKGFIELSIETSYCVNKLLNTLAENQILQDQEVKNLLSKNNQALATKKNRYKNLEAREQKMESELKKQIEKNSSIRKTLPAKIKNQSERKSHIKGEEITSLQRDQENKENYLNHQSSLHFESDYKSKFNNKIDKFRSQVNTLVPQSNMHY